MGRLAELQTQVYLAIFTNLNMYRMYIDESGDTGNYIDGDGSVVEGSSRYFTLAGIIVEESIIPVFDKEYDILISKYFSDVQLPTNFKLHYYPLRNNNPPYNRLPSQDRRSLERDAFGIINRLDCALVSVTIDLLDYYERYRDPASPKTYSLLLLLERFQYFLEDKDSRGVAIYERFNAKMRKKAELEAKLLQSNAAFPNPTNLNKIRRHVLDGDPTKEPILNLADFFAYLPFIRRMKGSNPAPFDLIKHKYFNRFGDRLHTGQVEM